jgi:5-methylcytosine-specific restriction endonuclease McrA
VLLSDDPEHWDKHAPLPPPTWFPDAALAFRRAVISASEGDVASALLALRETREDELREFFVEHGQMAYRFRASPKRASLSSDRDPIRSISRALERAVIDRDHARCRYCGVPVVPRTVLSAFARVVGTDAFPTTGTNAGRHGVVLAFRANIDHVVPYNRGGRTDATNLVTSCWSCNYGKNRFTVEELGIEDPRASEPRPWRDWTGLTQYEQPLRRVAAHRR